MQKLLSEGSHAHCMGFAGSQGGLAFLEVREKGRQELETGILWPVAGRRRKLPLVIPVHGTS